MLLPSDPKVCASCHAENRGCCVLQPGGEEHMFGLTGREIAAIAQASGLEPADFTVRDRAGQQLLRVTRHIHPVFAQTMPEGRRVRLAVKGRECFFLGPDGCRLPEKVRPYYCRLYPFWFDPKGRLMVLLNPNCLAQEKARDWREVLARIGDDEARLREIFAELLEAAAEHVRARSQGGP